MGKPVQHKEKKVESRLLDKKLLLPFLVFGLVLQGCGPGLNGEAVDNSGLRSYTVPSMEWSLMLKIGDYVLDSMHSKVNNNTKVIMDSITVKVPSYLDVPHIGRVYGWDSRCAGRISFYPKWNSSCIHTGRIYVPVDPLGYFDFSEVFDGYPLEMFNYFPQPECGPSSQYSVTLYYYAGEGNSPSNCPTLGGNVIISFKP
ncbi:MAG: hypothetical protein LBU89_13265 [Fibromonadaceae bacterium]|jgi:hypothetical protein|nr:hypothetical protein [Fibromonadaceae bacterium]